MSDDHGTDRRRFLKLTGSAAITTTVAGCKHGGGGSGAGQGSGKTVVSKLLRATPAGLSTQGLRDLGYPTMTANRSLPGRAVKATTASKQYAYTVVDSQFRYGRNAGVAYPGFVRVTPSATVGGTEQNPLAAASYRKLVTDGPFGTLMLRQLGLLSGGQHNWSSKPTRANATSVEVLNKTVTAERYDAEATPKSGGSATPVSVGLARRKTGSEAVIAGVAAAGSGGSHPPADRFRYVLGTAVASVTRNPPTSAPGQGPNSFRNARLVQTVARTRVTDGSVLTRVADPDLVAGENATPLFGLTGSLPERVYCEAAVKRGGGTNRTRKFWLHRDDAGSPGQPQAAKFDRATRRSGRDDPPTIGVGPKLNAVELGAEAPCGAELASTRLSRGSDYETARVRPVRIGFIPVSDATTHTNYGGNNGRADSYRETVDLAVQYLHRVFPGGLHAYRHDAGSITGNIQGLHFSDGRDGWIGLQQQRQSSSFPNGGTVYAPGGSTATAERLIGRNGFDGCVVVCPQGYFNFHNLDADGMALWPHNYAVLASERAAMGSNHDTAAVIAQELGHHFVDDPYDENGGTGTYPLAQRDDRGADYNVTGGLGNDVDVDHARHRNSNLDARRGTDHPGIVSEGYDLTDGRFNLVENYDLQRNGFDPDIWSPNGTTETLVSYMSYSDRSQWSDAVIHQALIDSSWNGVTLADNVFSAVGRVGDGGELQVDATNAFTGKPLSEDVENGPVRVSLVGPEGEPLETLRTRDSGEATHGEDLDGVFSVQLPFPERAVEFRVRRGDLEIRVNAIVRPLRDAVERIPERGFQGEPGESRGRLLERLSSVEVAMAEGVYGQALEELNAFGELVPETVREEYDRGILQPNRGDLSALTDRMSDRLDGLAG